MITINQEQKVYVIPCGNYFGCLGFDVAERKAKVVADWANLEAPKEEKGTVAAYEEYERIMQAGAEFAEQTGKRCEAELNMQLVGLEGERIEVVTEYGEKRRFIVGKSTGWLPCHLEIKRIDSTGGPAVEDRYKSVRTIRQR
jgi:hypothetical protein